ncbi:hypothetical protein PIB30_011932 [Stylosanthes scabra]|uniref:AT-hook motif nuclear-localized protein n=1 Tax=Stylosanthes scabra TaxID=79078 RepID=A0ABU6W6L4_9FABA|nr:hypothetical protein [Stylosanthes scabra]
MTAYGKKDKKKKKVKKKKMKNVQHEHEATITTTKEAALSDDDPEINKAEKNKNKKGMMPLQQTSPSTEAAENKKKKKKGIRRERPSEDLELVQDSAHLQTPSPEPESGFPNKKPRIEAPKSDAEDGMVAEKSSKLVTSELMVHPGEDLVKKIMNAWEESDQCGCIISATGNVSRAEFSRPNSNATHIYEGHFEVLSMSGHYRMLSNGNVDSCLSVTLADSEGKAFGGNHVNKLIASGPVGLLMVNYEKEKGPSAAVVPAAPTTATAAPTNAKASSGSDKKQKKKKKNKKKMQNRLL